MVCVVDDICTWVRGVRSTSLFCDGPVVHLELFFMMDASYWSDLSLAPIRSALLFSEALSLRCCCRWLHTSWATDLCFSRYVYTCLEFTSPSVLCSDRLGESSSSIADIEDVCVYPVVLTLMVEGGSGGGSCVWPFIRWPREVIINVSHASYRSFEWLWFQLRLCSRIRWSTLRIEGSVNFCFPGAPRLEWLPGSVRRRMTVCQISEQCENLYWRLTVSGLDVQQLFWLVRFVWCSTIKLVELCLLSVDSLDIACGFCE